MANKQMSVSVTFDGLDKKSKPVQSLANFFMENSSLYFKKNRGSGETVECTALYRSKPRKVQGMRFVLEPSLADGAIVLVSGTLAPVPDSPVSTIILDEQEYVVSNNAITIDTDDDPELWNFWDDLSFVTNDWAPGLTKSELLALAEEQELNVLEYTRTFIPGADSPDYNRIELQDSSISGTIYLNGILDTNEPEFIPDPVILINKEIEVEDGISMFEGNSGAPVYADSGWDDLVITLSPIVIPESKPSITCNAKLNTNLASMYCGSYDLSILYKDNNQDEKIPIAAFAVDEDHLQGLEIIAAKPGADGNNLKVVFSRGSGSDMLIDVYNGVIDEDHLLTHGYDAAQDKGYSDYDPLNNLEDVNKYIKFKYLGNWFEITGWYDTALVISLSGGADEGGTSREYEDGIIKCDTSLCKAKSSLSAHAIEGTGSSYSEEEVNDYLHISSNATQVEDLVNIPVTISPKVNGKINTDPDAIPVNDLFNEDGFFRVPLKANKDLNYDFQLRTTSFVLEDYDSESESSEYYDVFYKVGVCPIDGKPETRDYIVSNLMSHCIRCHQDWMYIDEEKYNSIYVSLAFPMWQDPLYQLTPYQTSDEMMYYGESPSCMIVDWEDKVPSQFPSTLCLPISDYESGELKGFVYFQMFNNDGTVFELDSTNPYYIGLRDEEDGELYFPSEIPISFKDYNIDKGFIKVGIISKYGPGHAT